MSIKWSNHTQKLKVNMCPSTERVNSIALRSNKPFIYTWFSYSFW
ncbi:hypothetical protein E2C01_071854 [Portunus trituberculatus]|uniref:Uncharacterized protein n=1 Tax=Portunus trituberculatus TaxID=210409 RepID=A0A5B7HWD4_PORTR|nr:hypothetical protein [Portunus trituberculatus]